MDHLLKGLKVFCMVLVNSVMDLFMIIPIRLNTMFADMIRNVCKTGKTG